MTPIQQQRLIGAGLLVLLVAVLAYVVLSKVGQHQTEKNLVLPEPIEFSSVIEPIDGDGAESVQNTAEAMVDADSQQTIIAEDVVIAGNVTETMEPEPAKQPTESPAVDATTDQPAASVETPQTQPATSPSAPAEMIAPEAAATETNKPTVVPEPNAGTTITGERWLIQLGSFSVQSNAQSLKADAEKLGYKPYIENSQTDIGLIYRVRLPEMTSRTQADDVAARIEKQLNIKTQVSKQ
ncbi:MAG TPA: SPOR domain-containing protein [Methylophaga sp.]|nr:SPOR domain-containing protein [Methylophaga sp.]